MLDRTARSWEHLARREPYWAVYTSDRFRSETLDAAALAEFFDSGEAHLDSILETVHRSLDPVFSPESALDYGCGVGRVLLPLARRCERVVGIDVSPTMRERAALHARDADLTNAAIGGPENLDAADRFDLVHCYIVLQHLTRKSGLSVIRTLLDHVADGGVAVLHVTYASKRHPLLESIRRLAKEALSLLRPTMRMTAYDLGTVMQLFHRAGFDRIHLELTDHDFLGAIIYAQRSG